MERVVLQDVVHAPSPDQVQHRVVQEKVGTIALIQTNVDEDYWFGALQLLVKIDLHSVKDLGGGGHQG